MNFEVGEGGVQVRRGRAVEAKLKPWFRGKGIRSDHTSNAELKLYAELQRRGLTKGMATQVPHAFDREADGFPFTSTDFEWAEKKLCVFLDGDKVHGKVHQGRKDDLVDKALERRGFTVKRFEYTAPLSAKRGKEIADEIEAKLK